MPSRPISRCIDDRQAATERLLAQAIGHINAGQREQAKALCEQALELLPPHPGVLQLRALLHLQDREWEPALRQAAASLARRPDHPPTLLIAGDAARQLGDLAAALGYHQRAHALQPQRADAALALGLTLQACGRQQAAQEALGAWLGYQVLPSVILLSSILGAACGIAAIALAGHDRRAPISFGPFLVFAGLAALFFRAALLP